ncbi:hypothetical protein [Haloglomus litoreum]|uniref:hypothetical protein n=1 Tax=Haloglomus litoreum TaxID=3034026 RepID=UPI0023E7BF02|nr:hypothetical protein [Haloglomus sp. DT116]
MLPVLAPLQLGALASPIGIVGAVVLAILAVVVVRFVIGMAIRIAIIAAVVVAALWFLGLLGPLRSLLGMVAPPTGLVGV